MTKIESSIQQALNRVTFLIDESPNKAIKAVHISHLSYIAANLITALSEQSPPSVAPAVSYTIVYGWSAVDLAVRVSSTVLDGWRPVGGVAIADGAYYQAMTKGV
jgi:hypothetical protein